MKRRFLNFATALSLILLLLTLALRARVERADDHFIFTIGSRYVHVTSWSRLIGVVTTSPWPAREHFQCITRPSPNETPVGPILFHHLIDPLPSYDKYLDVTAGQAWERTYVGPDQQSRWDQTGTHPYSPNDDPDSHETELMHSLWFIVPLTHFLIALAILPVTWCVMQVRKRMPQAAKASVCKTCGTALDPVSQHCSKCDPATAKS